MLAWDILDWLTPPDGGPGEKKLVLPDGAYCHKQDASCSPGGSTIAVVWPGYLACTLIDPCLGMQAYSSNHIRMDDPLANDKFAEAWNDRNGGSLGMYIGDLYPNFPARYAITEIVSWMRTDPDSAPRIDTTPGLFLPKDLLPINIPAIDPNSMPIGVPVPTPHPIPVPWLPGIKPNPDRVPSERPDNGPEPKPDPWAPPPEPVSPFPPEKPFPPNPRPDPGENPKPPVDPYVPSVDIDTGAISNNPWITPRPGRHYKRPPGSNEREKKTKKNPGAFYRILNGIVGFAGEAGDLVEAVYDALPKSETRWKGRDGKWRDRDYGPIEKAQRIYNNLDKLDVDKAIENIIANEAEDRLIGGLASGARKNLARKGWGDPNRNPFGTPSQLPDLPPIPNLK